MRSRITRVLSTLGLLMAISVSPPDVDGAPPKVMPNSAPLKRDGDIAAQLVEGVDRFLLRKLEESVESRKAFWTAGNDEDAAAVVQRNRERLRQILGLRDERVAFESLSLVGSLKQGAVVSETEQYRVTQVQWPVVGVIQANGLLLEPKGPVRGSVLAIGDADQSPEQLIGLAEGVVAAEQFPRRLAESGCRVLIPTLIDRELKPRNGRATLTSREYIYRSAYELGRHLIGYEVAAIQAGVGWLGSQENGRGGSRVAVAGWGEGGMLAMYAASVDERIDVCAASGFFGPRERIWDEPIDRNVFGLLERFGAAELTQLISPRPLLIEASRHPELTLPSKGGAPASLATPALASVRAEWQRAESLPLAPKNAELLVSGDGRGNFGSTSWLQAILNSLAPPNATWELAKSGETPRPKFEGYHPPMRQAALMRQMDQHNQWLLRESGYVREQFMKDLDFSSIAAYEKSAEKYREIFRHEVVGHFDDKRLPPRPRTRLAYDTPKWFGYDVALDVFPDVIAYGVLLVPKGIAEGERRPVVVCQHGLEGRPRDTIENDHRAYHDFAAKLAERGFVTFAPQNLYIGKDKFRTLQRKSYPIKKTLFSVIVPQHQQITDWLITLPYVDKDRIGFYGLSYGGKSAMRIPPLVSNYCLSICSADFNEWVWKNASTRAKYSYVWTGEYEIFEFDLGSTFNYAEMAALIAPRPFMVERGHFDGVAPDEKVAHEFAKVRRLYQVGLKMPERTEIEWFVGPHTIHGQGTFDFLHRHLRHPK